MKLVVAALSALLTFSTVCSAQEAEPQNTLVSTLMEELIKSIGTVTLSHLKIDVGFSNEAGSKEKKAKIFDLEGAFQVQLKNNIDMPITSKVSQKQKEIVPQLLIGLRDLTLETTLKNNPNNTEQSLLQIRVLNAGKAAAIPIQIRNNLGTILTAELSGLRMVVDGMKEVASSIRFLSRCDLSERIVDIVTRKEAMKPAQCLFEGYYSKANRQWEVRFCTDSNVNKGSCIPAQSQILVP